MMKKFKKTNYTLLNCIFIAGLLLIIVFYLIQINTTVSYSLDMKYNNQQIETLNLQNEHLVKTIAQHDSLENIYTSSHNLNLVHAYTIDYIEVGKEALAER